MDTLAELGGAIVGAAAGIGAATLLSGMVRRRGPWLFWVLAAASFAIGIAVIAVGLVSAATPLVWGGAAFPLATATALKWRSGRVPGVVPGKRSGPGS